MIRVIEYPQVKKYISPGKFFELMNLFRDKIQYISPDKAADDCRDIKDNFLLDLAVNAEADYLITGDLDLLE